MLKISYKWNYTVICNLCDRLLSLSIMFSKFIPVVACISTSFLAEQYSVIWIYHILFNHSSVEGYLSCFHILAFLSNAAMRICVPWSIFKCTVFYFYLSVSSYPKDPVKRELLFAPLPLAIDTLNLEVTFMYPGQFSFRSLLPPAFT